MRGRKPRQVTIAPADYHVLCLIARGETLPSYQVQRARIVLAIAAGGRTQSVARQVGCDEATVWRTCRRYEAAGLSGPPHRARPHDIEPPAVEQTSDRPGLEFSVVCQRNVGRTRVTARERPLGLPVADHPNGHRLQRRRTGAAARGLDEVCAWLRSHVVFVRHNDDPKGEDR